MDTFGLVFNCVATLFACMAAGFVCHRLKIITDEAGRAMSSLIVNVTLPCAVLYSMQRPFSKDVLMDCAVVILVSAVVFLSGGLTAFVLCRALKIAPSAAGVYIVAMTLPNITFMGVPVLSSVLGEGSLFYLFAAHIPFIIIAYTVCQVMITRGYDVKPRVSIKSICTCPAIIATGLGTVLFLFSITLPGTVNNALNMLGGVTTPLAMIAIGAMLSGSPGLPVKNAAIYFFALLRLVALPCAVILLCRGLIPGDVPFGTVVLICAMPSASMTAIFASDYGTNTALSSQIVCLTTAMSAVTIPLIAMALTIL